MGILYNLKNKSNDKKIALNIMLNFANGKISTQNFWEHYKSNKTIREILIKDKKRPQYRKDLDPANFYEKDKIKLRNEMDEIYYFAPEKLLDRIDINKLKDRDALYWIVRNYFITRKVNLCEVINEDANLNCFIHIIQPEWLGIDDEEFLIKVINMAPKELNGKEKEKWCRKKIIELFKYDKKPPKWMQNAEWPIINNKPLVFSKQVEDIKINGLVKYYFYDAETNEEVVIEQTN